MSHFSTIKTKIKEKPFLLEALNLLGHTVKEDQDLVVTGSHGHQHPVVQADICIATDIETWSLPTPPKRFIDKVTQQYARMALHHTVKEEGFEVAEEWEMDDNSIELTVTRWV